MSLRKNAYLTVAGLFALGIAVILGIVSKSDVRSAQGQKSEVDSNAPSEKPSEDLGPRRSALGPGKRETQLDEEKCRSGLDIYEKEASLKLADLERCSEDVDCIFVSFSDSCRTYCPRPVNRLTLGTSVTELQNIAEHQCGACDTPRFSCPGTSKNSVACQRGRCVIAEGSNM